MTKARVSLKIDVFWRRYLQVAAQAILVPDPGAWGRLDVTLADLAKIWDCSPRSAQASLRRLQAMGLIVWSPTHGRGRRSQLTILVHPVWIYHARAERAEAQERWAEAAFWYQAILDECPCVPDAAEHLLACRARLGLVASPRLTAACCAS